MFVQIQELGKDRKYKIQKGWLSISLIAGLGHTSSVGQTQVTGGYADNRGSPFPRRMEYVVTKDKSEHAMKGIIINCHVREAKIRNEQRMQDQVYKEWKSFPIKMKGSKIETENETKEIIRNSQKDTVNEACGLSIPTN